MVSQGKFSKPFVTLLVYYKVRLVARLQYVSSKDGCLDRSPGRKLTTGWRDKVMCDDEHVAYLFKEERQLENRSVARTTDKVALQKHNQTA